MRRHPAGPIPPSPSPAQPWPLPPCSSRQYHAPKGKIPAEGTPEMNDTVMTRPQFDRTAEDLGNIVELGHVNVTVPDQSKAVAYYLMGLGLTRDPYLMAGLENMWVNVGRGQFHLPTRNPPQVGRGTTGLV